MKFGIRWYNPTTGTWTQQDTLDAPLDPTNGNRYVFVGGDPINGLDPSGQLDFGDYVCGFGASGGSVAAAFVGREAVDFASGAGAVLGIGCGIWFGFADTGFDKIFAEHPEDEVVRNY